MSSSFRVVVLLVLMGFSLHSLEKCLKISKGFGRHESRGLDALVMTTQVCVLLWQFIVLAAFFSQHSSIQYRLFSPSFTSKGREINTISSDDWVHIWLKVIKFMEFYFDEIASWRCWETFNKLLVKCLLFGLLWCL